MFIQKKTGYTEHLLMIFKVRFLTQKYKNKMGKGFIIVSISFSCPFVSEIYEIM